MRRLYRYSFIAAFLVLTIALTSSGTTIPTEPIDAPYTRQHITIDYLPRPEPEEIPLLATDIIYAIYSGKSETDGLYQYKFFTPIRVLKGSAALDEEVIIEEIQSSATLEDGSTVSCDGATVRHYNEQTPYILFLYNSFYDLYDKYDNYTVLDSVRMPDYDATVYDTPPVDEVEAQLVRYLEENPTTPESSIGSGIQSDRLEDIIEQSPIIAHIRVTLTLENDMDFALLSSEYICTVKDVLKGDLSKDFITVRFRHDAVNVGEDYIVMVRPYDESKNKYHITSRNSVYSSEDMVTVNKIRELIA